jgi:hypothetical protein
VSTDPTTARMCAETGHDCPACPSAVRNLAATAHNAVGAWDSVLADSARCSRKMEELRAALAAFEPISADHFAALNAWRRP